jgi:hypothetical protein
MKAAIKKMSDFYGKSYNDEQIQKLINHMKVDNFQNNPAVNNQEFEKVGAMTGVGKFIRKGIETIKAKS